MSRKLTIRNSAPQENRSSNDDSLSRFEIDPIEIVRTMLRRRKWFMAIVGTTVAATIAVMLLTPNRYTSHAIILPSGKTQDLSALKAMAGLVGGAGMSDETSSTLYPVILRSHLVADSVLRHEYSFNRNGQDTTLTLSEFIEEDDSDNLYRALAGMTSISSNKRTAEITVAVETEVPEFSRQIVSEYISQLENYNLHSRRSKAKERIAYLSRELSSRLDSLTHSEDALSNFQESNRNWANTTDPFILKQLLRLKREVEIKTKTYAFLIQEHEIARLDAQKDIPIVRVLDKATLPTQKSGPFRSITVITFTFVSFFVVAFIVFLIELIQKGVASSDQRQINALRIELRQAIPFWRHRRGDSNQSFNTTEKQWTSTRDQDQPTIVK